MTRHTTMHVSGRTIRKPSVWTAALLFVALAAATLPQARSQVVEFEDFDLNTDNEIGATRQVPICSGICDAGVLKDPDLVIEYQWNRRVPVCSGLSCETASCAELDVQLGQYQLSDFECERHKYELQRAGCACTEPPPTSAPTKTPTEAPKVASSINESETAAATPPSPMKRGTKFGISGVAVLVALGLFLIIYIGVKHDTKLQAKSVPRESLDELRDEASYAEA